MKRLVTTLLLLPIFLSAACSSSAKADPAPETNTTTAAIQRANSDPLYSLTLMRQGSVLMQQGRFDAALESFEEADRIAPGNATVQNMIGLCHLRLEQFDKALLAFNNALSLIPGFTDARNNRGATYLSIGQYRLAEVDFVAVLGDSTYPHRKQVYYNLGMSYLQRGEPGAAEENFRKSIILPNPVFGGYLRLADLARRQGEMELALSLLEEAKLNFPDRQEVPLELGKLLMLMDRPDDARPYLEQVIADAPHSPSADTARALLGQT
jgi:tetratricopeptide (TPR) repeat protein